MEHKRAWFSRLVLHSMLQSTYEITRHIPALKISVKIAMAKRRRPHTHHHKRRIGDTIAIAYKFMVMSDGWATRRASRQVGRWLEFITRSSPKNFNSQIWWISIWRRLVVVASSSPLGSFFFFMATGQRRSLLVANFVHFFWNLNLKMALEF